MARPRDGAPPVEHETLVLEPHFADTARRRVDVEVAVDEPAELPFGDALGLEDLVDVFAGISDGKDPGNLRKAHQVAQHLANIRGKFLIILLCRADLRLRGEIERGPA